MYVEKLLIRILPNNLLKRDYHNIEHRNSRKYKRSFQRLDVQFSSLNQNQAKAIEQYYIENGPNRLNKINSISPKGKYKKFYNDALSWAIDYVSSHG